MKTYSSLHHVVSALRSSGGRIVTPNSLALLYPDMSRQGRYECIQRMLKKNIINTVVHGVYELTEKPLSAFEKAQAINPNSYISLETALNVHGVLSQFPHIITSVTPGKTKTVDSGQTYAYFHIKPNLYSGYTITDGYLMATPEKALIDYLYFASKGLRSPDISEFDLSHIDKKALSQYSWSKPYAHR